MKKRRIILSFVLILGVGFYFAIPQKLFDDPYSISVYDVEGQLLSVKIAQDEQWRFAPVTALNDKYKQAVLAFEDRYFYYHPGVNPLAIVRALIQNVQKGKVHSGGSTITMQVARLARKNKPRTIFEKCIEMIWATRIECSYNKNEILNLYASHAPFGGNIVGLEAASRRIFNRSSKELSWAEASLLAVLPNNPAYLHLLKNRSKLLAKRNRLLKKLKSINAIDRETYALAIIEPIPDQLFPIANQAPHLLEFISGNSKISIQTSIHTDHQSKVQQIVDRHVRRLQNNEINNAAALVFNLDSDELVAYVGNVKGLEKAHSPYVDLIQSNRSSGSILKPFLYAASLDAGLIMPKELVDDTPVFISGYAPKNFDRKFRGAVPADIALSKSLNVPAVNMLSAYTYPRFHEKLQELNFTSIDKEPDHYGLTLILGGAEVSLWEVCRAYRDMVFTLKTFNQAGGTYDSISEIRDTSGQPPLSAGAIWHTLEAMKNLERPDSDWQNYTSAKDIAWKTGTSFGHKDAWSIGINGKYLVGIWVGNADGEGRPGLTGVKAAAPIMFDIFRNLDSDTWFETPYNDLKEISVCRQSGQIAGQNCIEVESFYQPLAAKGHPICTYHKRVHVSKSTQLRVFRSCVDDAVIDTKSWFVIPPKQAFYYKKFNPTYRELPALDRNCSENLANFEIIYPGNREEIFLPRDWDGSTQKVVFEAAHSISNASIFWHIDEQYIATTVSNHSIAIETDAGAHVLKLVDEAGVEIEKSFFIF